MSLDPKAAEAALKGLRPQPELPQAAISFPAWTRDRLDALLPRQLGTTYTKGTIVRSHTQTTKSTTIHLKEGQRADLLKITLPNLWSEILPYLVHPVPENPVLYVHTDGPLILLIPIPTDVVLFDTKEEGEANPSPSHSES